MVTWDSTWSFSVTYSPPTPTVPKPTITGIYVHLADGTKKSVTNGGALTVNQRVTGIEVQVRNDGGTGTVYADLVVGLSPGSGSSLGQKSASVSKGSTATFTWTYSISSAGTYYFTARAGH